MRRAWAWWVAWVDRTEDRRPLTWVRTLVPIAVLGDLVGMLRHDAVDAVLYPASLGGIGPKPANWYLFDGHWWGGPLMWIVMVITLPLAAAGVATRWMLALGLVAYAQMGHLFTPGDRAIDRLLRTVMIVLICSAVTDQRPPERIRAWASDLVRWLLVMVYVSAGIAKIGVLDHWLYASPPELYTILADPMAGNLDPVWWGDHPVIFWIGGWGTMIAELSAPVVLVRRWAPYWALLAAPIHLGIALTMDLGMFSYGMLALYPVLLAPWVEQASDAWERWRRR
ncbi:MAG: HTTM domain-containing protein [Myxococcota bacterium]